MANPLTDALNTLQMIPGTISQAQGTVAKVDRKVDEIVDVAETYAAASLFISAVAAFSAFGLLFIQARSTGCGGAGIFSRTPRTELRGNPGRKKKKGKRK